MPSRDRLWIPARLLIATLLLAAVMPTAVRADTPDSPQSRAFRSYYTCLTGAIGNLDDGRSDAATIASAATSLCDAEWKRMLAAFETSMTPDKARVFRADWTGKRQPTAIAFVLKGRSLRR